MPKWSVLGIPQIRVRVTVRWRDWVRVRLALAHSVWRVKNKASRCIKSEANRCIKSKYVIRQSVRVYELLHCTLAAVAV